MSEPKPEENAKESGAWFVQTRWTLILAARKEGSKGATEALEELCRSYWYPLYAYVRRRGYSPEDAEDLTQSFFERLLSTDFLQRADPEKGRFRSFLLASLNRFLGREREKAEAQKRGGGMQLFRLEVADLEQRYRLELASQETPERMFERRWALTVLDQAATRLRQDYADRGKAKVFKRLQLYLKQDSPSGHYRKEALDLKTTPGAIRSAVHRLRERYGEMIRNEVARTVASEAEVDDEYHHLRSLLSGLPSL